MDNVKGDLEVAMKYANSGDHVTEIERNNITFKERCHAQYHRLPFQNILKFIIWYLDFEVVITLNYFLVKGGLSPNYRPWTIVVQ